MTKYVLKRLFISLITIFILITFTFFLLKMLPDTLFSDPKLTPAQREALRALYGLDKPLFQQYLLYLKNMASLDFGTSITYGGREISQIIFGDPDLNVFQKMFGPEGTGLFPSIRLGLTALICAVLIGVTLGVISALKRDTWVDKSVIVVALTGITIPSFVIACLLSDFEITLLEWGMSPDFTSVLAQTVFPVFCLGLGTIGSLSRLSRTSMVDVVGSDYVKTARSKGLNDGIIVRRHMLRNALLPVITVLGPLTAGLLCGTFVIESIFNIQGIGYYFVTSVTNRDYLLVLALTAVYGTFLITANFIVDIVYGIVDPRIRLAK